MAAGAGLPPLSLSTGPAISGQSPNSSTGSTGEFVYNRRTWRDHLAQLGPWLVLGAVAFYAIRKRRR